MCIENYNKLYTCPDIDLKEARIMSNVRANISIKRALFLVSTLSRMINSLAKYQHQMGLLLLFVLSVTTFNLFCLILYMQRIIGCAICNNYNVHI